MNRILSLLLCLFALNAQAETITLQPSGCGLTRYCLDVANDAGADIAIYAGPTYSNRTLYLRGVAYTGPNTSPSVMYAVDGAWLTLTTEFSSYVTCTKSGRGQHCSTHWTLMGGSVVLP
jgi:hypothetical protein